LSATRCRVLGRVSLEVVAELRRVDPRSVTEHGERGLCADEAMTAHRNKFPDRDAATSHHERLATIEFAHDLAAFVAELPLGDFPCHNPDCST
jgi:hypothetical protein